MDLKATFGRRYRYDWDEAYWTERPDYRKVEAPWLQIIPCKLGKMFPWGGRKRAAFCDAGGSKRRELESLLCVEIAQGGTPGTEVIVTFDVAEIEQVAQVLKARRPRQISDTQKTELVARLGSYAEPVKNRPERATFRAPEDEISMWPRGKAGWQKERPKSTPRSGSLTVAG